MDTPSGWPFLVAAGRRQDYRTLLAPAFLVADLDYGFLDTVVRPTPETGPATVVEARTLRRRRLSVVYATHRLTAADLIRSGTGADPRDEHGRPLRLIYGYVSPDAAVVEPAEADLERARTGALAAYRRFFADEERVEVTPSHPYPLRSRTAEWPGPRVPAPVPARVGGGFPRAVRWLAGAAVVAVLTLAIALAAAGRPSPLPAPVDCPKAATVTRPASCAPSRAPTTSGPARTKSTSPGPTGSPGSTAARHREGRGQG
jgi:hypothetical protein